MERALKPERSEGRSAYHDKTQNVIFYNILRLLASERFKLIKLRLSLCVISATRVLSVLTSQSDKWERNAGN